VGNAQGDGRGGWSDQGDNDMAHAPVGLRECRGIPFDIIDASKNGGKSVMVFKSKDFTQGLESVTIPLGGAKAENLYVLQAAANLNGGAAKFTLVYTDGSKSKTLQAWQNIRVCNWWRPEDGNNYKVAFVTSNALCDEVGMVAMEWKNECPEKSIQSLVIESYNKDTIMIVGAVTLSHKKESAFAGDPVSSQARRVVKTDAKVAPKSASKAGAKGDKKPAATVSTSRGADRFFFPPQSSGEEARNWSVVKKNTGAYSEKLAGPQAADSIVRDLLETKDQDALNAMLTALGYAFEQKNRRDVAGDVFDKLRANNDLYSTIVAADLLLKAIQCVDSVRGARSYPDSLCDRAAALLDHPDPVVQSLAEWTLALRLKKQQASSIRISDSFGPEDRQKPWFRAWTARAAARTLGDDYGRQLIQVNRHRTLEGLKVEMEKTTSRMSRFVAAPGSDPDKAQAHQGSLAQALAAAQAALAQGDLQIGHVAYIAARTAARDVIAACRPEFPNEGVAFYTNYNMSGGDSNVNAAVTNGTNRPGGDIYWKQGADPAIPAAAFDVPAKIGDGSVRGMDLTWEADKILFSYWIQPLDPKAPTGWDRSKNAHLFELDVAARRITQLTKSPGDNDIEPCYLPDGGVIFASDRSSFGNQCAGAFLQDKRCTTLYRIDPRRADKPVAISNNKDFDRHPHILNDGTVVFMHWEYQERDLYHLQTAWRCRPDGTNMDAFYKQHIGVPYSIRDVQQAPNSQLCVATAQGHHDGHNGPVILFNPSLGINNPDTLQLVTPGVASVEGGLGPLYQQVVPEGGVENRGGSYINPFPMSDKAFLVGHDMEGVGLYQTSPGESDFAIYYIDVWGNRELIHRDREMSCFMPHPLRKRPRPPVVADTVDPKATFATAFVEDVYRDLPGVARGAVKYLRISQALMLPAPVNYDDPLFDFNHLHWLPGDATGVHFGHWTFAPRRTVGLVKVEPDGSAYFKVPAGTPVYLQALDENYCEVRRMRTSFTLQRGEFRGCTGCHESRLSAVGSQPVYPQTTLNKGPQTPEPPSWGDCYVLDYRKDIQPTFDRLCVRCHGQGKTEGGLDLTGRPVAGFTQSYRSLFGIKPGDPQIINDLEWHARINPEFKDDAYISGKEGQKAIKLMQDNQWPGMLVSISNKNSRDASVTQPYQFGSNKSLLIRKLLDDPKHRAEVKSRFSDEEWLKLVTWVDYNANFHSTLVDKSKWNTEQKLTRVPYYLPSPWIPADLNPSFCNKTDTSIVPDMLALKGGLPKE